MRAPAGWAGAGGAAAGAGGGLVWDDDGVTQRAEYLVVTRANDARYNYLEVSGTQLDGPGVSLSVSVGPAGVLGGSYPCNPADPASPALFLYSGAADNDTLDLHDHDREAGHAGWRQRARDVRGAVDPDRRGDEDDRERRLRRSGDGAPQLSLAATAAPIQTGESAKAR